MLGVLVDVKSVWSDVLGDVVEFEYILELDEVVE